MVLPLGDDVEFWSERTEVKRMAMDVKRIAKPLSCLPLLFAGSLLTQPVPTLMRPALGLTVPLCH